MGQVSVSVLICVICTLAYGIGLLKFVTDFEDKCEMTYTFEYPQFVRISLKLDEKYPKYGLYAYSEGRFTAKTRKKYFDGIPVLFIPGNGGSHKQVRSMSSVALRKMLDSGITYHFDYFTVNLNEELSGLYGPLLFDQLEYINSSLFKILELYKERKNRPESVVIIGHSMGGVIGMKLLSQISDPKVIPILIALASPLRRPPFMLDYHMKKFYDEGFKNIPESTTLISLSGGYSDFLIPAYLSDLERAGTLYAVTTNVPRAWIETNHVQILWCKQIVLALNRALFDSVNMKTMHISSNSTYRSLVFHHHLVRHSGTYIRYHNSYSKVVNLAHKGQWIESVLKQYSIKLLHGVKEPHWYMVKLTSLPGYEVLSMLTINLKTVDWIFICNANTPKGSSKVCTEGYHLTHLSEIAPSVKYKRKYFQISLYELRRNMSDATHVVFRVLPTHDPLIFHVDVHGAQERRITVDLPKWWSLDKKVIVERTFENALHYELVLPDLHHIIQYYQLFLDPVTCAKGYHHASASLIVPWSHESYHSFVTSTETKPLNIRLYSSRPKSESNRYASIRISLEPACTYRISIKSSIAGSLGQISRTYSSLLLTNVAVIILMSLNHQLKCLEDNNRCSILFVALREGAKPYYILTVTKILSHLCGTTMTKYLPKPDILYMINEGTDFFIMPLFMYVCGLGIVCIVAVLFGISVVTLESTVHNVTLKLLARTVSFNMVWSDYLMSALHKIPFVVAVTLILLSLSTCGGLALCLGGLFYFLRLTQMSKDFVEDIVWFFVKRIVNKLKHVLRNVFKWSKARPVELSQQPTMNNCSNDVNRQESFDDHHARDNGKLEGYGESSSNEACRDNLMYKSVPEKIDSHGQEESVKDHTRVVNDKTDSILDQPTHSEISNGNNLEGNESVAEHFNQLSVAYNAIFFHTSLFFLWIIITIINIPAVLTWAHNFKFSKALSPDDSFIPGITLSMCALPLWQAEIPKIGRKWMDKIRAFIMVIAVTSLLFATVSVYRLNYLLTSIIVVITLHQLFAPLITNLDDSNVDEDKELGDIRDKYENIKTKLD